MNIERFGGEQLDIQKLAHELAFEVKERIEKAKSRTKKFFSYNCNKVFDKHDIELSIRYDLMKEIGKILDVDEDKYLDPDDLAESQEIKRRIKKSEWDQQREEWRAGQSYKDSDIE